MAPMSNPLEEASAVMRQRARKARDIYVSMLAEGFDIEEVKPIVLMAMLMNPEADE
jgi:hypothetical protein